MNLLQRMQESIKASIASKRVKQSALRFTATEFEQLESTARYYKTTNSEVIRLALINLYNALEQEKNNRKQ